MQLDAGFHLARVVTVEDGVAAHLEFVQVFDRGGVGGGGARLEVDDGALLDQIENTDKAWKPVVAQVGFNGHFYGVRLCLCHGSTLPDVGV